MLNKRETAKICEQLRSLLGAGVPALESFKMIVNINREKKMLGQLHNLIDKVSEGYSISEAALGFFPPLAVSSIAAGERVGRLEDNLNYLAKYYDNKADLDDKVAGALVYPMFVLGLCLLSIIALVLFVLPGFKGLFADLGTELPLLTKIILGLGDWFMAILILIVIFPGAFFIFLKSKAKERTVDKYLLKLPLFGGLIKQELIIQSLSSLGALLNGGTPIVEALAIVVKATTNRLFQGELLEVKAKIENGETFSQALVMTGFFPEAALQMIKVGESSGNLAGMLTQVADCQAREREQLIKRFTSLLEPMLTLFVGLVVGLIILAVFLPMISMISNLK